MAIWTVPHFTSGIYRARNPKSTLHLAAVFHVSVCFGIDTRNDAASSKSPAVWPYGVLEAPVKDFGARKNLVVLLLTLTTMLGCSALDAKQPAAQQAQKEETANNRARRL